MALNRITGAGVGLGAVQYQSLKGGNEISLLGGQAYVFPAGQYIVTVDPYAFIQVLDPISGLWRSISQTPNSAKFISADGYNYRLINLTGCAIGAYVTNVGSGYTSVPTVTASAGSSTWQAILGGAISQTVTVATGGTLYTYPPLVMFGPPPAGGVQATGYATLSANAVTSITVVDQGAGYVTAPAVTLLNDPRDTTGSGATATTTIVGANTLSAIVCTNPGTALTAVPTLSVTGGGGASGAATAVMCLAATGITTTTPGVAYGTTAVNGILTMGGKVAGAAGAIINPTIGANLLTPRMANITATGTAISGSAGAITTTIADAGLFSAVPTAVFLPSSTVPTTTAIGTVNVGSVTSTSIVIPI